MELLYKAHHMREMDFSHLPQIWKQSIQMSPFCWFYQAKIGSFHRFTEKVQHWRANLFGGNGTSI